MTVNQVAFATTTTLSIATGVVIFAAATTASTVAMLAYSILAVGLGGASVAAVSAWLSSESTTIPLYFTKMKGDAGYAISGFFTFVSQTLLQALIQGVANGISKAISRRIAGADHTVRVRQS